MLVLESIFLALFGFAIFMLALTAWDRNEIVWPTISFIVWTVLAVSSASIEREYAFLILSGRQINTVTTHITSHAEFPLALLFLGIAFIFVVIAWTRVSGLYRKRTVG